MNVNSQSFEAKKQAILKNKCEFIQIQLQDIEGRKSKLLQYNNTLKQEIKTLKEKKKSKKVSLTISIQSDNGFAHNEDSNEESLLLERMKEREKYLYQLEKNVKQLKDVCVEKVAEKEKVQQWRKKAQDMKKNYSNQKKQDKQFYGINIDRKKTFSVHLNENQNIFSQRKSKLSQNQSKMKKSLCPQNILPTEFGGKTLMNRYSNLKQRDEIASSLNNSMHSTLNNSIISRGTGKSYGRIITKLICQGCGEEHHPYSYYNHIEECLQFEKFQLLKEKQEIEEKIDVSMNNY